MANAARRPCAEVLTFSIRDTVADLDETSADEPLHPTAVLVVASDDTFTRVVLPQTLCQEVKSVLMIGNHVEVSGNVVGFPGDPTHVATEVWPMGIGSTGRGGN